MRISDLVAFHKSLNTIFPLPIHSEFKGKHNVFFIDNNQIELGVWVWDLEKTLVCHTFAFLLQGEDSEITEEVLTEMKVLLINNGAMHPDYTQCQSTRAQELPDVSPDVPGVILRATN